MKSKGSRVRHVFVFALYASLFTLHAPALRAAVPDGYVVRVASATVYLDWGKTSGVQVGDTFDIYRGGDILKHPVTGEILGQTDNTVAQGMVESIQEKFCIAHVLQKSTVLKAGDRTRLKPESPQVSLSTPVAPAAARVPTLIWQSSPIIGTPRSMALGDVQGNGMNALVIAFADRLDVYTWQNDHLEKLASYADKRATNWLSVDVADPDHTDHLKIFATWFADSSSRARVAVIEWSSGTLKEIGHFDGFARVIPHADGRRPLIVQDLALGQDLRFSEPRVVGFSNGKFGPGDKVPLPHPLSDRQLFGFAWGDWDNDKAEDFASLLNAEQLRVYLKDKKWTGDTSFGGTKLVFSYNNRALDAMATVSPRLTSITAGADKPLLLASYNESSTILRFSHIKAFRSGEVMALAWDGQEMTPLWHIASPMYVADYAAGSLALATQSEVWILGEKSGDKSVVTGYKLP